MAMQTGLGLSRILLIVGAGYTGTIVVRNGKLSEILAELQAILNEKSGENPGSDADHSEAIASQVRRLAMEVRKLAVTRPVTVVDGSSGNMTSLIVTAAATFGALLGYGYMWWNGNSLSDLMYVTKKIMDNAVASMTEGLEQISSALAATKRHLTERIKNVEGELDEQKKISKEVKGEVVDACSKISKIGSELKSLQQLVSSVDTKINAIEDKQRVTCEGVTYLCQFVHENGGGMPEFMQDAPKLTGKPRYSGSTDSIVKGVALAIESWNFDEPEEPVTEGLSGV